MNGTGPPSQSKIKNRAPSPPSLYIHHDDNEIENQEDRLSSPPPTPEWEQPQSNPRGGVIGRTPTPPSAPTPIYEKDDR